MRAGLRMSKKSSNFVAVFVYLIPLWLRGHSHNEDC